MESIVVSEQEINNIEALLLSNNHQFASDAREVIRCWESKDVAACPGSGKTTILLAKLKILYDRMPLENNAGVCVLSHTNVAVDEIKTRLSDCADKLMGYPNYVGTIQSFIDRFVVTPYLKKLTNTAIQVVDNEIYTQHLLSIIAKQRKYNKLLFFFRKQYENSHYDNLFDFCKDVQLKSGALYVGKQRRAMAGKASDSAKLYTQAIDELLQTEGMIRYKDAYTYTHEAIEALTTEYTDLFCKRFSYVFIDEYQDCNKNQRDALDKIFNPSKCCVMHIGDPDQTIYNSEIDGLEDWVPADDHLSIAFSCRYGQEIADVLKALRSGQKSIYAAAGNTGFQPTLIVYDDESRGQVVGKFIAALDNNQLDNPAGIYKVIGAVKNKELKGLKISDYWAEFDDRGSNKKDYRYWSYIDAVAQACCEGRLFIAEQNIRKLLCKIFHYIGAKNKDTCKEFTVSSIKQTLDKEYFDVYRDALITLSTLEDFSRGSIDSLIQDLLQNLCEKKIEEILVALPAYFLEDKDAPIIDKDSNSFIEPLCGRRIQFDTIHGVKGETHDATLILETERSRSSDVKSIFTYFGVGNIQSSSNYNRKCLYVAMSRPRKLLCLAIQDKSYEASKDIFSNWKLIDCRKK